MKRIIGHGFLNLLPAIQLQFALFAGFVACAGCGSAEQVLPDRATVSGTVTFGGTPLRAGTIGFKSAEGPVTTAAMIKDGAYSTDRAPIGKNLVTVDTYSIQVVSAADYIPIPERYSNSDASGLTADVKPGENENVNFVLEK